MFSLFAADVHGVEVEVGTSDPPPRQAAYLKVSSPTDPGRFAVVSTPGERWFFSDVSTGFGASEVDEDVSDDEIRSILRQQVEAAIAYVRGEFEEGRTRFLRLPILEVRTSAGVVTLSKWHRANLSQFG